MVDVQFAPRVPPNVDFELSNALFPSLHIEGLVGVIISPRSRSEWLDMVRIMGSLDLNMVDPQRLRFVIEKAAPVASANS